MYHFFFYSLETYSAKPQIKILKVLQMKKYSTKSGGWKNAGFRFQQVSPVHVPTKFGRAWV